MPQLACPECYRSIGRVKANQDARCRKCRTELEVEATANKVRRTREKKTR